jgi:hypothetical protein
LTEAAASCAQASPGFLFALYIHHLHEAETRHRSCKYALMEAEERLAAAIIAVERAAKAVKAVEAKAARILQDAVTVDTMFVRQQAVAKEYADDATKLQQQMQRLIAEREYADHADFAILSSLITDAAASRCQKRRRG